MPGVVASAAESPDTLDCVSFFLCVLRALAPDFSLCGVPLMAPARMEPVCFSHEDHLPQLLRSNGLAPVFFASAAANGILTQDGPALAAPLFRARLVINGVRRMTTRDLPFRILA